ncbi:hypothetical protein RchiOBHm_Chr1g0321801 [Rosa chinensis]|uniref:Uncharacterized protein n=1 Tax=Rosa chinensis TaxID=74649 RepID=A0A2P6S907_ROSCH|nr:hypothetical protein RchiOBHm_Chr1g0321801 [Rosa chinensis]
MSAGTRNNFENKFWAKSQDSGSIHSFYDVGANPLDKQVSISKSDKRRRLMLKGTVGSSIQDVTNQGTFCFLAMISGNNRCIRQ